MYNIVQNLVQFPFQTQISVVQLFMLFMEYNLLYNIVLVTNYVQYCIKLCRLYSLYNLNLLHNIVTGWFADAAAAVTVSFVLFQVRAQIVNESRLRLLARDAQPDQVRVPVPLLAAMASQHREWLGRGGGRERHCVDCVCAHEWAKKNYQTTPKRF